MAETTPEFREWFLAKVRESTSLEEEQEETARFALVEHLDMAGARGAARGSSGSPRSFGDTAELWQPTSAAISSRARARVELRGESVTVYP